MSAAQDVEVQARLISFINETISLIDDPVDQETDLVMTGAVDSLGVVQITLWMEDELGVTVDPLDVVLENFQTIEQMADYVARQNASAAGI